MLALVAARHGGARPARGVSGEPALETVSRARAASASAAAAVPPAAYRGFLYGRVHTLSGLTCEGRLRFGGDQEAFWSDFFNGEQRTNPWVDDVPPGRLPKERDSFTILGFVIPLRERPLDVHRVFVARFGDLARIDSRGRTVRVTLKSGRALDLDRLGASDFDDGVRVWDAHRGVVDLAPLQIRSIELLPTAPLRAVPARLRGTVRTRQGVFTGFVQWSREQCTGEDELAGRTAEGERRLRFDAIRAIARRGRDGALVTLRGGGQLALRGGRDLGEDGRGIYVDDPRYGRVLVSWGAFERADLEEGDSGPAYGDFAPGRPLAGRVTTRAGRRLAGRLVFDLDESETTETLDAPWRGVGFHLPFGLVAAIVPAAGAEGDVGGRVTLASGETLRLERAGDLRAGNGGMLIFAPAGGRPAYVPWPEVARVDLDRPPATGGD